MSTYYFVTALSYSISTLLCSITRISLSANDCTGGGSLWGRGVAVGRVRLRFRLRLGVDWRIGGLITIIIAILVLFFRIRVVCASFRLSMIAILSLFRIRCISGWTVFSLS